MLDRGDQWAAHVAGSGGVQIAAAEVAPPERTDLRAYDRKWLAAQGIEWGSEDTP